MDWAGAGELRCLLGRGLFIHGRLENSVIDIIEEGGYYAVLIQGQKKRKNFRSQNDRRYLFTVVVRVPMMDLEDEGTTQY